MDACSSARRPLAWAALAAAWSACASDARPPAPIGRADAAAAEDAAVTAGDAAVTAGDAGEGTDAGDDGRVAVTFEVTVPEGTPADPPVHVAGDFQGWDPADPAYALTARDARTHLITLRFAVGQRVEFKFARGDWSRVEKSTTGGEVPNRAVTVAAAGTLTFTVARWADTGGGNSSITGHVEEQRVPEFLGGRRFLVYLPPNYATDTSTVHYPVLYMFDGQNVFDRFTSFAGEWRIDEALEAGIPTGRIAPVIVVAIDNGAGARIDEYTPWPGEYDGQVDGGEGGAHLAAIVGVLKPWVDAHYRTRPGREDTGLMGSSLGGLMAMYAAFAHADVFGRIGALSPSIWWADERLNTVVAAGPKPASRVWTDMGTAEGETEPFRRLRAALITAGFVEGQDLRAVEVPGAPHNESAWAARAPQVLEFLFPPR